MMPWLRSTSAFGATEGLLRPDRALDRGTLLAVCAAPDNLVWQDGHLLFTSGKVVLLLDIATDHGKDAEEILRFESEITAMAAAKDGSLAVGQRAGGIAVVGGEHDGTLIAAVDGRPTSAPTALCFADPQGLIVALGSESAAGGSVWRVDLRGGAPICLADRLASPAGLLPGARDALVVVEASRQRLLEISASRPREPRVLLDGLPGFPGRLASGSADDAWLPICPPRAATESHGLFVRLNSDFEPIGSLQAGPGSRCHGFASCLEARGELIVACKEGNALISVDLS